MRSLVAIALAGCVSHVPLAAPQPYAPPEAREQTYASIGPALIHDTGALRPPELILRDGSTVVDPTDLLAVVPVDSPTARAAHRARAAHSQAMSLALGGLTIELAGAVWSASALARDLSTNAMQFRREDGLAFATVGVGAVIALASLYYFRIENRERAAAFATYDASLRAHLRLCTNGLAIVACP